MMTSTAQRLLDATSCLPKPLLAEVLADMSLASSPPRPQPTTPDASLVSYRLTPAEIALLRQGKKSISDYVQGELPARLAQFENPTAKQSQAPAEPLPHPFL